MKQAALFEEHRERVFRGQTLVTIVQDAPVDLDLEAAQWGDYNRTEVVEVLKDLEFFSTINRLPPGKLDGPLDSPTASDSPAAPEVETHYTTVQDSASLGELVRVLTDSAGFAFDTETAPDGFDVKGVQPMRSSLVGLSFATEAGRAWYVPVGHIETGQLTQAQVLEALRPVLEDPELPKAAHNGNYDLTVLSHHGVRMQGFAFDTMLAAHLLGHKAIGLKNMSLDLLGIEMTHISDLIGSGRTQTTMDRVAIDKAAPYACADADMTFRLWVTLDERIRAQGRLEYFTRHRGGAAANCGGHAGQGHRT